MTITDQTGVFIKGVSQKLQALAERLTPGGATNSGTTTPITKTVSRLRRIPPKSFPTVDPSNHHLPPVGTTPRLAQHAAPHPGRNMTELALSRGFRNIRKG